MTSIGDVAVSWSRVAPRTVGIANRLGLELVAFGDKFPYIFAFKETLLRAYNWDRVILQLPPGPALAGLLTAKILIKNFEMICDVHTGMIVFRDAKQALLNSFFVRMLKRCDYVLAHNRDNARLLNSFGIENVVIIYDPVPEPIEGKKPLIDVKEGRYIIIPAGWDTDEPFDYLLSELGRDALSSVGYKIVITGDYTRTRFGNRYSSLLANIKGVVLTGYLHEKEYVWLLKNAVAVLGMTKSNHIMLRAFWEAAAYSKPVIAPRTKVTVEVMGEYPYYYYTYVPGSLIGAIQRLRNDPVEASQRAMLLSKRLKKLSEESMRKLKKILEK